MSKILLLLPLSIWVFFLPFYGKEFEPLTANTIEGNLYFKVEQKQLQANLQYQYIAENDKETEINLFLSQDVNIDKLEGEDIKSYHFDKEASPISTLTIIFKQPLTKGEITNFTLSYSGKISKGFWTDQYGWIDIDPDFMILPLFKDFKNFNYKIKAEIDDPAYKFIDVKNSQMSSTLDVSATSVYYFESIVAGKTVNFDQVSQGPYSINIISGKPDSVVSLIGNKAMAMLDYFNHSFGGKNKVNTFTILYRPLPDSVFKTIRSMTEPEKRFIMFSDNHERFPTLAHEISHFWWNRGNDFTMEKWLEESFAEYAKLMYIREAEGQKIYQKEINRLEKEVKDLPSILQSDRFGKDWSKLLYQKGPYLLYQLEEIMSRENFMQFLTKLNENEVSTTEDLLHELEKASSVKTRDIFEDKLMN